MQEDVEGADAPDIVEEYQLSDDEEGVDDGMDFAGGSGGSSEEDEEDADDEQPRAADSASDEEEVGDHAASVRSPSKTCS